VPILGLLAPDFALIALGFALRRWARFGDEFWPGLERVVYFVFFPALLFKALAQSHVEFASAGALLATAAAATLVGIVLAVFARRFVHADPISHASAFQCAFRFNSYLGFAIIGGLHGDAGIAAMALIQSLVIPLVNVVAVWALARHGRSGIAGELVRNPLIVATVAGAACNLSGLQLPAIAAHTLTLLAQAALPIGLIAIGASVREPASARSMGLIAYVSAVKLVAVPAAAWWIAQAAGLTGVYRDAAVLFGALPSAPAAFILASRMGADGPLVARILAIQLLVAAATLPLWLSLLLLRF
jgi:malonate transporter